MAEKRKQLRERILLRQSELLASRELLRREAPISARLQAVDHALAALDVHLSGGWEQVGPALATQLSKWLEQSQFLVEEAARPEAEMIFRRLETRVRLEQLGLPEPPAPTSQNDNDQLPSFDSDAA